MTSAGTPGPEPMSVAPLSPFTRIPGGSANPAAGTGARGAFPGPQAAPSRNSVIPFAKQKRALAFKKPNTPLEGRSAAECSPVRNTAVSQGVPGRFCAFLCHIFAVPRGFEYLKFPLPSFFER